MATPGALNAFAATGDNPSNYIVRYMNLDPGTLGADDQLQNLRAVRRARACWRLTNYGTAHASGSSLRPTGR